MFAKVFSQIFDSSIANNYATRHVFMDLLVLADSSGVVDMTLSAISRRTNVPIETVISAVSELMSDDPESRSHCEDGRRLIPIDSNRSWGWQIVNSQHYRQLQDEEARRSYFRDKKKEYRDAEKKEKQAQKLKSEKDITVQDTIGQSETVLESPKKSTASTDAEEEEEGFNVRESVFPSVKEASLFFEADFPNIKTNHSLSEMVQKKNWTLTESNCRRWLSLERGHGKKKLNCQTVGKEEIKEEPISLEEQSKLAKEFAKQFSELKHQINGQNEGY